MELSINEIRLLMEALSFYISRLPEFTVLSKKVEASTALYNRLFNEKLSRLPKENRKDD